MLEQLEVGAGGVVMQEITITTEFFAVGLKDEGTGKGKGKEECDNFGSSGHFTRECPYPKNYKGKGKGGFQG